MARREDAVMAERIELPLDLEEAEQVLKALETRSALMTDFREADDKKRVDRVALVLRARVQAARM